MKKVFIAVIFLAMAVLSCSDDSGTEPVVYVGGSFLDGGQSKACYWVNGERHELEGESVRSITAVKGIVYAAGYYLNESEHIACYWADGIRNDLPGLGYGGLDIGRISVNSGNVYVLGVTVDDVCCYWVNGVKHDPPSDGVMGDMLAVGGKEYIAGYYTSGSVIKACYWVNGSRRELPESDNFFSGIIAVENNNVCVFGGPAWFIGPPRDTVEDSDWVYCYWFNGKNFIFPTMGIITSCAVSDGDVYMAGSYGCFKNGKYYSDDRPYYCTVFAVSRGKVYICGYESDNRDVMGYSIDGEFYPLDGSANAIFVE